MSAAGQTTFVVDADVFLNYLLKLNTGQLVGMCVLICLIKINLNLFMKVSLNGGCNSSSNRQPDARSETLIRPEEVAILLVVFGIWLYACGLFYARYTLVYCSFIILICCRWTKLSRLETWNLYKAPTLPDSQVNVQNSLDVSDGR